MKDDTLNRLFDRLGIGESSPLPSPADPLEQLPRIPRAESAPAWRTIVEPGDDPTPLPALPPVPVAALAAAAGPEIVLRGELATAPRAYDARKRLSVVTLAELLYRLVSFSVSALAHVCVGLLLVLIVVGATDQEDKIVSIVLGRSKGKAPEPNPPGEKPKAPEAPPKEEPPTEAPPVPAAPAPEPPVPAPPEPAKPVEPVPGVRPPKPSGDAASVDHLRNGRTGPTRAELVKKYGGSEASESAVEAGLAWLAKHQDDEGSWDGSGFHRRCPKGDSCHTPNAAGDAAYTHGITGLAVLSFLGAGYVPQGGTYSDVLDRALKFLVDSQHEDGGIDGEFSTNMYNHAIAAWALCETYAVTKDAKYAEPARRAIRYIADKQYPDGGWDYYPAAEPEFQRNDTSIAGWCVMALKSAKLGGIEIPSGTVEGVRKLIEKRTDRKTGELVYAEKKPGVNRKGLGLLAVGMACRFYLDMDDVDPLRAGAQRLHKSPPSWEKMEEAIKQAGPSGSFSTEQNMYAWYYGTLAMFQMGGEYWQKWNATLQPMLLNRQAKSGHKKGSWTPEANYIGREGGRVFATAINVLNLEIYYRYLPMYEVNEALAAKIHWNPRADLLKALKVGSISPDELAKFPGDEELAALVLPWLANDDMMIRLAAVKGLVKLQAKAQLPRLAEAVRKEPSILKGAMIEHLAEFRDAAIVPLCLEALGDVSPRIQDGALNALKRISGMDFGMDRAAWSKYFAQKK